MADTGGKGWPRCGQPLRPRIVTGLAGDKARLAEDGSKEGCSAASTRSSSACTSAARPAAHHQETPKIPNPGTVWAARLAEEGGEGGLQRAQHALFHRAHERGQAGCARGCLGGGLLHARRDAARVVLLQLPHDAAGRADRLQHAPHALAGRLHPQRGFLQERDRVRVFSTCDAMQRA